MKTKVRLISLFLVILMSLSLIGCANTSSPEAPKDTDKETPKEQLVAKIGHVGAPDHIFEVGAKKFSELVFERTDGAIKIDTYPSSQLGGDRDMFEGLKMGTIEFTIHGPLDSFLPITSVIALPYMFNDSEHVYTFLDSPEAERIYSGLEDMGITCLAHMENGWRLITSNKEINTVADMKGLKIRTPESPVWMDTFQALGANPMPLAFSELYGALQQGVADGQENPTAHIVTQRFYEVQDYLTLSRHMYLDAPVLVSNKFWDKLTPEQQTIVKEAAYEAAVYQREVSQQRESEQIEFLKKEGMKVTEPNVEEFRQVTEPVRQKWAATYGQDLYNKIVSMGD